MTQKKTMTKNEAREFLKGRQYKVVTEDLGKAFLTFANRIGIPSISEDSMNLLPHPFYISFDSNGRFDEHKFRDHGNSCQPIEVLLSIEIVEEHDHRALLEEAVKLLDEAKSRVWYWQALYQKKNDDPVIGKIEQFLKANRP